MKTIDNYCLIYTNFCFPITQWKEITLIACAIIGAIGVALTAWKTIAELKKYTEEKRKEQDLKSIEFTLSQQRRLFDDQTLYSVLCLIDTDDLKLANEEMWDAKRKFLVFFEEIQLLIYTKQTNQQKYCILFIWLLCGMCNEWG